MVFAGSVVALCSLCDQGAYEESQLGPFLEGGKEVILMSSFPDLKNVFVRALFRAFVLSLEVSVSFVTFFEIRFEPMLYNNE